MPHEDRLVQEFIARENIIRWTGLLAESSDERQADTLRGLIQSEKQHLHELREEATPTA